MSYTTDVIAVIDDDRSMRETLKNLLWAAGYEAELYDSAAAFLNGATETEAMCLLLDVQLGATCGIELAGLLGELGFDFSIIFMSGSGDEKLAQRALNAGVAFLRKPFSAKELVEALFKAMR